MDMASAVDTPPPPAAAAVTAANRDAENATAAQTTSSLGAGTSTTPIAPVPVPVPVRGKKPRERSFQAKLEWRLDEGPEDDEDVGEDVASQEAREGPAGVLKCRCDQRLRIGLLYEGRYKSLLFSLGTDIDLGKLDAPFRTVGLAVQFAS